MRIVVSGLEWMGAGFGSIETAVDVMLHSAHSEVAVVTYSITSRATSFFDRLEECLERGVRLGMLIDKYRGQQAGARTRLAELKARYPNLKLFSFEDPHGASLHAKIIVVDRKQAVVGSANVSFNGFVRNHEFAVMMEDPAEGQAVAQAVDRLFRSPFAEPVEP